MKAIMNKQNYLERKREVILNLGYEFVAYRSHAKKSLNKLKHIIQNNACHFEGVND